MNRFTLALFALAVGGVLSAHAYSTDDLKSAGWTQVTDLSDVSNNFYVFVDAGASATFMVRGAAATDKPRYTTLANPQENPDGVWVLEANGSNYAIKGIKDGYYFNSGDQGYNDGLAADNVNGNFTFTLNGSKYDLTSVQTKNYVGPWGTTVASSPVSLSSGYEDVAANKTTSLGFYIFAMPRATYLATYLAKASSDSPIAVTGILDHSTISDATPTGWTLTRDGGATPAYGSNLFEVWNANSFTLEQTATVPSGEYTIGVNGFYRAGDGGTATSTQNLYLFGNTSQGAVASINSAAYETQPSVTNATWSKVEGVGFVPNNMVAADYAIHTDSKYANTLSGVVVSDGSLNLGLKRTEHINADWSIFNNFSLACTKLYIDGAALTYTDGATLAADTWYVYNVLNAGTYTLSATDGIVYTQNGSQGVNDEITSTSASSTITLTAGKLYVKSSTAQALTITPASYTYNIGEATINVKDGEYIQSPTIKVTFPNATTDNTAATVALASGATATVNNASVSLSAIDNGFSLDLGTLTANTDYSVTIPANVYGYDGQSMNAEITLTLKTPALFDGTYFFRVANDVTGAQGKYLSRGLSYGTHATVDAYGLPIQVTTNSSNVTTLSPRDTRKYYYHTDAYDLWADNDVVADATNFVISLTDGNYYIHYASGADGTYFKFNASDANNEEIAVYDDGTSSNATVILWAVETATEHSTKMQALKDAQAASVAAAAYAASATDYASLNGISTASALETELTSKYVKGDFVAASDISSVQEKYEGDKPNSTPETVYSNTINITEPGLYKFSMKAFYRAAWNDVTQAMHTDGVDLPPVVLFFGDSQTQIKSLYDEEGSDAALSTATPADVTYNSKYYANNTTSALAMFKDGKYDNDVWLYISKAGTYTYGVKYMGFANAVGQWFIYSPESVTITSYAPAATSDDYAALKTAIAAAAADGHTLGFEKGEYAPYNNVDGINGTTLAKAKAIVQTATNSKLLVNSMTTTLNSLWTANTEEVNAVNNGTLKDINASTESTNTISVMAGLGWTNGNSFRQILADATQYPALSQTTDGRAVYVWGPGTYKYGETAGYTIPLKGNTKYQLTVKYCGWNGSLASFTASVLDANGNGLAAVDLGAASNGVNTAGAFVSVKKIFTTGDAGNYTLSFTVPGNAVFADVEIVKAVADAVTLSDDNSADIASSEYADVTLERKFAQGWNSLVLPFETTTGKLGAAEAAEYKGTDGTTINFSTVTTLAANTPYIVYFDAATTESKVFEGVAVAPSESLTVTDGAGQYNFVGTYTADTTSPIKRGDYYVVSDGIQRAAGDNTIKAFRAYFAAQSTTSAAKRMVLSIDGDVVTAIDGVSVDSLADDDAPAYNLAGQRVGKSYKGVVVKNGKKLIRK